MYHDVKLTFTDAARKTQCRVHSVCMNTMMFFTANLTIIVQAV